MPRDTREKQIIKKALAYFNEEVTDEELENDSAEPTSGAQINEFLVGSGRKSTVFIMQISF